MSGKPDKGYRKGYSLLEIMIVVGIVALLAAIAVNTFMGTADKHRVENETKEMFANLMDARARALQRSRVSFVRVMSTGYELYEDTYPAPDGNGVLETTLDRFALGKTAESEMAQGRGFPIRFITNLPGASAGPGSSQIFQFDRGGVASINGNGYIRLVSDGAARGRHDYDCIVIGPTRVKMGLFNVAGGTCEEK